MDLIQTLGGIDARHLAQANYEKTLVLLWALKEGAVAIADVHLSPDGWQIVRQPPPAVPVAEPVSPAPTEPAK